MNVSRAWLVVGMLAPALAAAQPGPDDSQQSRAPAPVYAPAPTPVYAPAPTSAPRAPPPSAYAGPPGEYGGPAPWQPAPPPALTATPPVTLAGRKSPATAGWTSCLVTAGGLVLMIVAANMDNHDYSYNNGYYEENNSTGARDILATVGAIAFVVGPTTGHIYAGHTWNTGLGIRLASVAAMTIGVSQAIAASSDETSNNNTGDVIFILGAIGYGVGTIAEISLAPGAARDYNRAHGLDMQLSVIPVRDTRNASTPGIGLVGRF